MVVKPRMAGHRWALKSRSDIMRVLLRALLCCAVMFAAVAPASVTQAASKGRLYAAGTPTRAIQDLDGMLDAFKTGDNLTAEEEAHNRKLKHDIIHGTFDLRELSKQSLSRHWKKRSSAEQDQFVQILTDLLEEKALFSKEQSKGGGKYYVVYKGHKFYDKAKTRAFVGTRVSVPSEDIKISLNYRLKKKGDEWKIYDVVVDEASLVDNYRYQFNSIITKHGYPDLIRRMNEKLASIRADRKRDEAAPKGN